MAFTFLQPKSICRSYSYSRSYVGEYKTVVCLCLLVCLWMWLWTKKFVTLNNKNLHFSRRWKREQEKADMSRAYSRPYIVGTLPPPPSYHPTKPPAWAPQPSPAYPRWANHVEAAQNIYAVGPVWFFLVFEHFAKKRFFPSFFSHLNNQMHDDISLIFFLLLFMFQYCVNSQCSLTLDIRQLFTHLHDSWLRKFKTEIVSIVNHDSVMNK